MKRRSIHLNLPMLRKMREMMDNGETIPEMIRRAEEFNAQSARLRYRLKTKPWTVTIEVRRRKV